VISDRYKLIGYPNTFDQWELVTSLDHPVLELYDISTDPAETSNLADRYPEILEELRTAYDHWFDDVKDSREFLPGWIHIGSAAENPVYLSRYQDASYVNRKPEGWPVYIERAGPYEITVIRDGSTTRGEMTVECNGTRTVQPVGRGEARSVFSLPEGHVHFNAYVTEEGEDYIPRPDEDKIGDVLIRYITPR
jgi:hypothetical protein